MSETCLTCAWCGRHFERQNYRGPVPRFCSSSHRQRAYEERKIRLAVERAVKDERRRKKAS